MSLEPGILDKNLIIIIFTYSLYSDSANEYSL